MGKDDCIEEKKILGIRIARMRAHRGLSQREFAGMIGMDRVYLSKIETGSTNPSLESLVKIARGFDVGLGDLFQD